MSRNTHTHKGFYKYTHTHRHTHTYPYISRKHGRTHLPVKLPNTWSHIHTHTHTQRNTTLQAKDSFHIYTHRVLHTCKLSQIHRYAYNSTYTLLNLEWPGRGLLQGSSGSCLLPIRLLDSGRLCYPGCTYFSFCELYPS